MDWIELDWIGLDVVGLGCTKCAELGFKERLAGKAAACCNYTSWHCSYSHEALEYPHRVCMCGRFLLEIPQGTHWFGQLGGKQGAGRTYIINVVANNGD